MVSDTGISRTHFGRTSSGTSAGGAVNPSAASTSTSARARCGWRMTNSVAAPAPNEWPTMIAGGAPSARNTASTRAACASRVYVPGRSEKPNGGRSSAITRKPADASASMVRRHSSLHAAVP